MAGAKRRVYRSFAESQLTPSKIRHCSCRYQDTTLAVLVDKLLALSPAQRLTLAETLEQVWHIDLKEGIPIA